MGMVVIQLCFLESKLKKTKDKVPTVYWLPKLHKNIIKQNILIILVLVRQQNLLTSCPTAVKKHVITYCEKVYERSGKNLFWSL